MSQNSTGSCACYEKSKKRTPAIISNPPGLSSLKYRVGTHSQFKADMLELISRNSALKHLTTREDDDLSIALLDCWATIADVLSFYQERIANEGYIRTATERRSVLELSRTIGYELKTGVAASTHVAFTVDTADGSPLQSRIDEGTKIMSIPGQDETLQIFETIETIEAKATLNTLKPLQYVPTKITHGLTEIYLKGVTTNLIPGDAILFVGPDRMEDPADSHWAFRFIRTVTVHADKNYTHITWANGLGPDDYPQTAEISSLFVFRQRASLFGYNAPDWKMLPVLIKNAYLPANSLDADVWPGFELCYKGGIETPTIRLDAVYSKILKESWVALIQDTAKKKVQKLYKVLNTGFDAQPEFTLNAKTTTLDLDTDMDNDFGRRDTVVYCVSESLEITDKPLVDLVFGNTIILDRKVPELKRGQKIIVQGKLAKLKLFKTDDSSSGGLEDVGEFLFLAPPVTSVSAGVKTYEYTLLSQKGDKAFLSANPGVVSDQPNVSNAVLSVLQLASLSGKQDTKLVTGEAGILSGLVQVVLAPLDEADSVVCEVATVSALGYDEVLGVSIVTLDVPSGKAFALSNVYDLSSVCIYANVALATHGETTSETLGSGDSLLINQRFRLKKPPLTYVSAATASGVRSTLKVFVNDVQWEEASSLCFLGPNDPGYITRIEDNGDTIISFGDGKTGVRLPSGAENITASYRSGIGLQGAVAANKLTLLAKKPFGIRSVTNPLAASGAAASEQMADAKINAPSTVLTLGRIVSLSDYENFARNFLGIAKAYAVAKLQGNEHIIRLIVAPINAQPLDPTSMLYLNLKAAVEGAGAKGQKVYLNSFKPKYFDVTRTIYIDSAFSSEEVIANAKAALLRAFSFEQRSLKQAVTEADISSVIQLIPGVIYVETPPPPTYGAGSAGGDDPSVPPSGVPVSEAVDLENPADDELFMVDPDGIVLEVK